MNKRDFLTASSRLAIVGGAAALGIQSAPALAQSQGYAVVDPPQPTKDPAKVEVLEFFWFGCPHCYAFEPTINSWAETKPDYVSFVREAPPLNPGWEGHSRSFYAAEALGVTEKFFDPMFHAIHQEKRPLRDPKKIAKFAGELGIDEEKFYKAMFSFTVESSLKRSVNLAYHTGITGVPSILINGRYRTGNSLAGGHEGIVRVINKLAAEEHSRMQG